MPETLNYDVEQAVKDRYGAGAQQCETALCCPTSYDPTVLKVIPAEILERDYGCGDPSKYVRPGETVLDLGSGGGKICYILSQVVGKAGRVLGVDMNDDMLDLAKRHQSDIAKKIGHDNVIFFKGRIQDLALDLNQAEAFIKTNPITDIESLQRYEAEAERLRADAPMIADDNVDVIVSNCVLNLVKPKQKQQLFAEMFRVLKRGGRCVISDIVCDEQPTEAMRQNADLWSGCLSGAFEEHEFLQMFAQAGFYGIEILERSEDPWQTLQGIEFRSVTVVAYKGKQGPCLDRDQAVVYRGPWSKVTDDDGHTLFRGERMAVCDKTFGLYTDNAGPYAKQLIGIQPHKKILPANAPIFNCKTNARRDPRATKGQEYNKTTDAQGCCSTDGDCC